MALIPQEPTCQGTIRASFAAGPASGCSPARRSRTSCVELGIAEVTLYKWRRQALIDAGERPGLKSYEADPLAAARRRIKELEAELKVVKAASALFEEGAVEPKRKFQVVRGLNNLGYSERLACAVVGLERSTYYDIKFRKPNDREIRRLMLADAIADIHARSRGTYGILRVKAALEIEQGLIVNTKLVKRIMRELGIRGLPGPKKGFKNLKNARPARTWSSANSPPRVPTSCG